MSFHTGIRGLATARTVPRIKRPVLTTFGLLAAGGLVWDDQFNAKTLQRTCRTIFYSAWLSLDYKLNFNPENSAHLEAIHERTADKILYVCEKNGGLYIKIAQNIAMQGPVLPKAFKEKFANVFDHAPHVAFDQVEAVFAREFGCHPDDMFDDFEREPIASASIAQVHRARLKPDQAHLLATEAGAPSATPAPYVAVKVRKPDIPIQMKTDLFAYRTILRLFEYAFELPLAFIGEYVTSQMRMEADLLNEAHNSQRTLDLMKQEPSLKDRVTVPKVVWELTSPGIMTAEFISDAANLTDTEYMHSHNLNPKKVMDTATSLFSAMVFKWGWLHCDPHPGNVLIRPHPLDKSRPQIVLIDHGLYIPLSNDFRIQYCQLWRYLFTTNFAKVEEILGQWGVAKQSGEMFASMTMLRPYRFKQGTPEEHLEEFKQMSEYEKHQMMKEKLRGVLANEKFIPRELIFISRTVRMIQSNNQSLGAPTNRINIMANWALFGLGSVKRQDTLSELGWRKYSISLYRLFQFKVTLFVLDLGFYFSKIRQKFWSLFGIDTSPFAFFSSGLQQQVTDMARTELGVELDESVFEG